jgi:hypothetical protein
VRESWSFKVCKHASLYGLDAPSILNTGCQDTADRGTASSEVVRQRLDSGCVVDDSQTLTDIRFTPQAKGKQRRRRGCSEEAREVLLRSSVRNPTPVWRLLAAFCIDLDRIYLV